VFPNLVADFRFYGAGVLGSRRLTGGSRIRQKICGIEEGSPRMGSREIEITGLVGDVVIGQIRLIKVQILLTGLD